MPPTQPYPLSLHDALPIYIRSAAPRPGRTRWREVPLWRTGRGGVPAEDRVQNGFAPGPPRATLHASAATRRVRCCSFAALTGLAPSSKEASPSVARRRACRKESAGPALRERRNLLG